MTRWSTARLPAAVPHSPPLADPSLAESAPAVAPPLAPNPPNPLTPRHVAVIMDGNGRWAAQRGLRPTDGHRAGTENIRAAIESFGERGIRYLTLFAFSTENWRRPRPEIRGLMRILSNTIDREVQPLHEAGVQLRYIGRIDALSDHLRRKIDQAVALTANNTRMTVCIAFNYGGAPSSSTPSRRIAADGIPPDDIDEALIRPLPLHRRHARSRPDHPHRRRPAPLSTSCSGRPPTPSTSSPPPGGPISAPPMSTPRSTPTPAAAATSAPAKNSDRPTPTPRQGPRDGTTPPCRGPARNPHFPSPPARRGEMPQAEGGSGRALTR